ncbi:MAG: glycosyltransferase family 2 protein [Flavobacterium sp.]
MANMFSATDIQILVSTMQRDSLDFLADMFPNRGYHGLNILVINQGEKCIDSGPENIKFINTPTKGLSVSRNLALDNATGALCILADDDVVFEEDFETHIVNAFAAFPAAAAITFQYRRHGKDKPAAAYMPQPFMHNNSSVRGVSSVEIVVNREILNANNCRFNVNFGLGAYFEIAEEFLLLRALLSKKLVAYYYPASIVLHDEWSSGRDHGNDRLVYGRAALACKLYGNTAGLWLVKYLQFLVRKKIIPITAVKQKFKVGMQGIKKYKSLLNEGNECRED